MSEGKEIPKYYDFSYLLHSAEKLSNNAAADFLRGMPNQAAIKLVASCLVLSLVTDGDIFYEKDKQIKFTGTEGNITKVIKQMSAGTGNELAVELIAAFSHRPKAARIYEELLNFEIAMINRGAKPGPIRCMS